MGLIILDTTEKKRKVLENNLEYIQAIQMCKDKA